jgi:hypothetical protein
MQFETLVLGVFLGATLGNFMAIGQFHLPTPFEYAAFAELLLRIAKKFTQ